MRLLRIIALFMAMALPCLAQYGSGQGSYGTIGTGSGGGGGSFTGINSTLTNVNIVTTSGTNNVLYVNPATGSDANTGTTEWSALATLSNAVLRSYPLEVADQSVVINLAAGNYIVDNSAGNQYTVTNTHIIGKGPAETFITVTTNGTGAGNAVIDCYGNFTLSGVWWSNAYQNLATASYPVQAHTFVGNATNLLHVNNCVIYGQSDDVSYSGSTTGGKTWPGTLIENSYFYSGFDACSTAFGQGGATFQNMFILCDVGIYGTNGFGNAGTSHGITCSGTTACNVNLNHVTIVTRGFTNQFGLYIGDQNAVVNAYNSSINAYPGPGTQTNAAIWTAAAGILTNNNVAIVGTVYNLGAGTIAYPETHSFASIAAPSNTAPFTVVSNFTPNMGPFYTNLSTVRVMFQSWINVEAGGTSAGAIATATVGVTNSSGAGYIFKVGQEAALSFPLTNENLYPFSFQMDPGGYFQIYTNTISGAASQFNTQASTYIAQ